MNPFWQILLDIDDFESSLCSYLERRTLQLHTKNNNGKGPEVSMAWLSMLFAVLASASQFSDLAHSQRVTMSQAFSRSCRSHVDPPSLTRTKFEWQ